MKTSTDRILTTHVGSLPRPPHSSMLKKRDRGEPYDAAELAKTISAAVDDIVAKQAEIGIDVVSDGETSKASYSTYIKERLSGFSDRDYHRQGPDRLQRFPGPAREDHGRADEDMATRRLSCTGPSSSSTTGR